MENYKKVLSALCPLQGRVRFLYISVCCLAALQMVLTVFLFIFYNEVNTLKAKFLDLEEVVEFVNLDDFDQKDSVMVSEDGDLLIGDIGAGPESINSRQKRQVGFQEGSGDADDWMWMSSFARVPTKAIKSYCQEAKTYCAASGPPGQPGDKGDKGDKGNDGTTSTLEILGRSELETLRGPPGLPGLLGEKGETGSPGLEGPKGDTGGKGDAGSAGPMGPKGEPGLQGLDGLPGKDGVEGRNGLDGQNGPPGNRGSPGAPGPKGVKGDPGFCSVQCKEFAETHQPLLVTTPAPTFPPRHKECSIEAIGRPLYMGESSSTLGAWMVDMKAGSNSEKVWVTYNLEGDSVIEYSNMDNFEKDRQSRNITLGEASYYGTGHIVYGGHLYYQWSGVSKVVKVDLSSGKSNAVRDIPDLVYKSEKGMKRHLYSSESSFVDFSADENGLWMIYGTEKRNNLRVALINPDTLDIINYLDLDIPLGSKGEAFIMCGKLITLRHHNRQKSFLDSEYDLWSNTSKPLNIAFGNPYGNTVMLSYEERKTRLLIYDKGKKLRTPMLLTNH